jgi:PAS domain S-box-containing protein
LSALAVAGCPERYCNLLEQASEGVFIADAQGRCLIANPAGARMLGHTPRQIVGRELLAHIQDLD